MAQNTSSTGRPQGTHFYVMTIQNQVRTPAGNGIAVHTQSQDFTPDPGWTRADIYNAAYNAIVRVNPQLSGGNVIVWSLEPNQL
ncbi:hypothetical protein [Streptomyces bluensis]|uniref:Uncharacterized protein n=1 Tax=Streptomyces bluensis TaxID=33897 RepID=A0ABW6UU38_9ACTN